MKIGDPAPDIALQTDSGASLKLSRLRGKKVVLFFYPRANTPGCTIEACEFRDTSKQFTRKGAVVIGISPDTVQSQAGFKSKFDLPYDLLADVDKSAAQAFGVWREKNMYGKKVMGIVRSTFVIDEKGKIAKIYDKVTAKGHAEAVLAAL